MSWELEFTKTARREIGKLNVTIKRQIEEELQQIAEEPGWGKLLHGKLAGIRSCRSGDYRILYGIRFKEHRVTIFRVTHRREVYR